MSSLHQWKTEQQFDCSLKSSLPVVNLDIICISYTSTKPQKIQKNQRNASRRSKIDHEHHPLPPEHAVVHPTMRKISNPPNAMCPTVPHRLRFAPSSLPHRKPRIFEPCENGDRRGTTKPAHTRQKKRVHYEQERRIVTQYTRRRFQPPPPVRTSWR